MIEITARIAGETEKKMEEIGEKKRCTLYSTNVLIMQTNRFVTFNVLIQICLCLAIDIRRVLASYSYRIILVKSFNCFISRCDWVK